jgi:hyaluronan synthase
MLDYDSKSKINILENKGLIMPRSVLNFVSQLGAFSRELGQQLLTDLELLGYKRRKSFFPKLKEYYRSRSINSWIVFFLLVYSVLLVKFISLQSMSGGFWFKAYSVSISSYILSRFLLSYFYECEHPRYKKDYEPTVSFGVPALNEGENICETIVRIAESDYPRDKFDIIAINDGSRDNTLAEIKKAQKIAAQMGVKVKIVDFKVNRGKRAGMAESVIRSRNDIIIFIDSDSFVEKDTVRELVKYFSHEKVGAVAGHAFVANAEKNMLTKMQAARYFVAFKAYKSAEALFSSVMCCSGCCAAYRREYVLDVLEEFRNQTFLGAKCTYGDDRSLTNFLLERGYETLFNPRAISHTIVPDNMQQFLKQQLRWKKSWTRECLIASRFMWKKHPIMSISFYMGVILTLVAPIIVARAIFWYPLHTSELPYFYLLGLLLMSLIYGVYYSIYVKDNYWIYGVVFTFFYTLILIWQLPYAFLTLRDPRWGTR